MSKTEALNISLPDPTISQLKSNSPFQWSRKGISYLCIVIPPNLSDLYSLNYSLLLTRIWKDLDLWNAFSGRVNMLKMDTLPKLLYLFQTVPILVPKQHLASLLSMSICFIWKRGLSRIRYKLLTYPKLQGGVGVPDFELYHKASVLARILDWFPRPFP